MDKVFIVVMVRFGVKSYETDVILRVFSKYESAVAYGEQMVKDGVIEEFDVYEREVYA